MLLLKGYSIDRIVQRKDERPSYIGKVVCHYQIGQFVSAWFIDYRENVGGITKSEEQESFGSISQNTETVEVTVFPVCDVNVRQHIPFPLQFERSKRNFFLRIQTSGPFQVRATVPCGLSMMVVMNTDVKVSMPLAVLYVQDFDKLVGSVFNYEFVSPLGVPSTVIYPPLHLFRYLIR